MATKYCVSTTKIMYGVVYPDIGFICTDWYFEAIDGKIYFIFNDKVGYEDDRKLLAGLHNNRRALAISRNGNDVKILRLI